MNFTKRRLGQYTILVSNKHKLTEWWVGNKRHRIGKPAVKGVGYEQWWKEGKLHREDGPAVIYKNGLKEWYFEGEFIYSNMERVVMNFKSLQTRLPEKLVLSIAMDKNS